MRIAGEKVGSDRVIEVRDPYTGAVVGTVPKAAVADVRRAFDVAARYRSPLTRHQRAEILRGTAQLLDARREEISDLITAESGLCKKDTIYEVGRACDVFNLSAQLAILDDGQVFSCDISPQGKKRRIFTQREPLKAISAITPFNHPLNQVAHKVAPSIATNNRMVLKPSEKTPLTALLLADVLYEAGLPPEMFSVVTGDPAEIGDELITNPNAELITFTGGVAIGKLIASKMGYRRVVVELGGNDPLIVLEDADLDKAADLAAAGSYKNSGQRCTAVKRILVQESVADRFVEKLVARTLAVKHGDPTDPKTEMGTVIDEAAARYCEDAVNDAVARGAKLLCGNQRRGALYSPTVVDHVPLDARLVVKETFGPVSPILRFRTIDDAIRISNSTAYGLSSGVCTDRLDWATRFINELEVGTVNIWEVPGYRIEMSPFGGIKDSGLGYKEGVLEAMKSFTNVKTFSLPWP
jgi:aldehyde dehydrogenase (NAD+)